MSESSPEENPLTKQEIWSKRLPHQLTHSTHAGRRRPRYDAVAAIFEKSRGKIEALRTTLDSMRSRPSGAAVEDEVASALRRLERIGTLAANTDDGDYRSARSLFSMMNARLFLKFEKRQCGRRLLNKLAHGEITFGTAPPPVPVYTGRASEPEPARSVNEKSHLPGEASDSIGNVSRGDMIRTCDFRVPNAAL